MAIYFEAATNRIICDSGTIYLNDIYEEALVQGWDVQKIGNTYIFGHSLYITGDANFLLS